VRDHLQSGHRRARGILSDPRQRHRGPKTVDASKLDLMRSLDASRWQTFRYVTFPNALPFVFAGLDIAIVFSVLGAIVGEFVGSQRGLGNLILQFHTSLDIAGMFAVLLLLA